jgi:isopentenyl-diphosphate Delta-isomerase
MPQPLIQIVDDNDVPLRGGTKEEAWTNGLRHRIARISVLNSRGQLLVQKRSFDKPLYPGCWDISVSGHVDEGETYMQAALRELSEEIGISCHDIEEVGRYYIELTHEWRNMKRFVAVFRLVLPDPVPEFTFAEGEVESAEWMDVDKVKSIVQDHPETVTDGLDQVISRYF